MIASYRYNSLARLVSGYELQCDPRHYVSSRWNDVLTPLYLPLYALSTPSLHPLSRPLTRLQTRV